VAELVLAEQRGAVGLARLNRPDARNALSPELMEELASVLEGWDTNPEVRCGVIAGGDDFFASGADIRAMAGRSFQEALIASTVEFWSRPCARRWSPRSPVMRSAEAASSR
jgi:enoyl-CoA hydratase/carnithine racemase